MLAVPGLGIHHAVEYGSRLREEAAQRCDHGFVSRLEGTPGLQPVPQDKYRRRWRACERSSTTNPLHSRGRQFWGASSYPSTVAAAAFLNVSTPPSPRTVPPEFGIKVQLSGMDQFFHFSFQAGRACMTCAFFYALASRTYGHLPVVPWRPHHQPGHDPGRRSSPRRTLIASAQGGQPDPLLWTFSSRLVR